MPGRAHTISATWLDSTPRIWGVAFQHGAPTPHLPSLVLLTPQRDGHSDAATIGVARGKEWRRALTSAMRTRVVTKNGLSSALCSQTPGDPHDSGRGTAVLAWTIVQRAALITDLTRR